MTNWKTVQLLSDFYEVTVGLLAAQPVAAPVKASSDEEEATGEDFQGLRPQ
jgi:hypothetical protein